MTHRKEIEAKLTLVPKFIKMFINARINARLAHYSPRSLLFNMVAFKPHVAPDQAHDVWLM